MTDRQLTTLRNEYEQISNKLSTELTTNKSNLIENKFKQEPDSLLLLKKELELLEEKSKNADL